MKKKAPASDKKKKNIKSHINVSHLPTKPPGILFFREAATIIFRSINSAPNKTKNIKRDF